MGRRDRTAVLKAALVGALTLGTAVYWSVPAVADAPPADPTTAPPAPPIGLTPPPAAVGNVLAQNGSEPAGPLGLPDLSAHSLELLLGQNAAPAPPGTDVPVLAPDLRAFNNQYLLPQNVTPAAPGQSDPDVGIGSDDSNAVAGRLDLLKRLHAMYQAGDLDGALLGQRPAEQLGEPLPGTAPGPEIYLPPGLGQNLSDPAAPPLPPPG